MEACQASDSPLSTRTRLLADITQPWTSLRGRIYVEPVLVTNMGRSATCFNVSDAFCQF